MANRPPYLDAVSGLEPGVTDAKRFLRLWLRGAVGPLALIFQDYGVGCCFRLLGWAPGQQLPPFHRSSGSPLSNISSKLFPQRLSSTTQAFMLPTHTTHTTTCPSPSCVCVCPAPTPAAETVFDPHAFERASMTSVACSLFCTAVVLV
jgi:hypothetical protein